MSVGAPTYPESPPVNLVDMRRSTPFPARSPLRTFGGVIWLQSPPWGRWALALLIAAGALWVEFRPERTAPHPFALEDIAAGTLVDEANTETRMVPVGTFAPVEMGKTAMGTIDSGDPVLSSDLGELGSAIPEGWWSLEIELPRGANNGDSARIVLLDSDDMALGVVVEEAEEDPLGSGLGLIAVEADRAADVAQAVGEGRAVVLIAPP